jgi:hypothetical protein
MPQMQHGRYAGAAWLAAKVWKRLPQTNRKQGRGRYLSPVRACDI